MKSMILSFSENQIPMEILNLAIKVNDLVGDKNISVTITDGDTGMSYYIRPNETIEKKTEITPLLNAAI